MIRCRRVYLPHNAFSRGVLRCTAVACCDQCPAETAAVERSTPEAANRAALQRAHELGWVRAYSRYRSLDLCPECQAAAPVPIRRSAS